MKSFEQYLEEIHAKGYTGTDDNMPDSYNEWVERLDVSEVIEYAEQWGTYLLLGNEIPMYRCPSIYDGEQHKVINCICGKCADKLK